MSRPLQVGQHHNLDEVANVQTGRCAIKADISRYHTFHQGGIKGLHVGALVNKSPGLEDIQKI